MMDIEDAHKLKIITTDETKELLMAFFSEDRQSRLRSTFQIVNDINEQIAYLRSSVIGLLVRECTPCLSGTRAGNTGRNFPRSAHQAYLRRSGSRLQSLCGNITEKNLSFARCTGHRAGRLPHHQHFAGIDGGRCHPAGKRKGLLRAFNQSCFRPIQYKIARTLRKNTGGT